MLKVNLVKRANDEVGKRRRRESHPVADEGDEEGLCGLYMNCTAGEWVEWEFS